MLARRDAKQGGKEWGIVVFIDVHMSSIITTSEVVLQLCAERHRKGFVLLERRFFAVTFFAVTWGTILGGRFPKRSECQMFCRLGGGRQDLFVSGRRSGQERGSELELTHAGCRKRRSYPAIYARRTSWSKMGPGT